MQSSFLLSSLFLGHRPSVFNCPLDNSPVQRMANRLTERERERGGERENNLLPVQYTYLLYARCTRHTHETDINDQRRRQYGKIRSSLEG